MMGSRFKSLPLKFAVVLLLIIECSHAKYKDNGFEFVQEKIEEQSLKDVKIDYRLPTTVIPESYEIIMHPVIDEFTFTGNVKIEAVVKNETNKIILHHGKLSIQSRAVNLKRDGKLIKLEISNTTYDETTEKYSILLKDNLKDKAKIIITIAFNGKLTDNMIGFYRSSYFDDEGKIRWLAATQFQATHARHAFPCFDEPAFKATFSFTILRTKEFTTLSNMPKSREQQFNSTVHDIYEPTQRMSTYLCAFVISDFDYLEKGFVKAWTQQNHTKQAEYALDIGSKSLEYFGKLFDEPYALKKMDLISVPDFAAGAMENWGAMLFKTTRMLYNPDESSDYAQQVIASVVVHECAHNWFGNLVTPMWWDSLWLSEGFARYFQYYATAKIEPKWEMEKQFVVDQLQNIFFLDGLDSSKPMTRSVETTSDIADSGDKITYNKGASVIRMMDLTFGSSTFNEALKAYLKNKKYNSVVPDDLWNALQKQITSEEITLPETVKKIMESWTTQAGYPVLNVTMENGFVEVSQERFYIRNPKSSSKEFKWWIPLTWTTKSENKFESTTPKFWLNKKNDKIKLTLKDNEWVIFNIQQAGFYRVNYDQDMWYRIINVLNSESFKEIHEINRAAILDDLLNLARAGYIDYSVALDGLKYIVNETSYIPLKSAFTGLEYLEKRFAGQSNYKLFANYVLKLISRISAALEFDDKAVDNRLNRLLRAEVNNWACKLSHKPCIDKSKQLFSSFATIALPVPKNQRSIVYCSSIKHGSHSDWMKLWDRYLQSDSATEQSIILEGLACSQNQTILEIYLLSAITNFEKSRIRRQDSVSIFNAVSNSGLFGAEYILDFIQQHHLKMKEYYGDYDTVAKIIATASQRFSTKELVDKFSKFIKTNDKVFESVTDSLKNSLELAEFELNWYHNNERSIVNWIRNDNYDNKYRLPTSIKPKSYKIMVTPHLNSTFTFNGTVEILTTVVEETDIVVFHSSEIEYYDMSLSVNGAVLETKDIVENTTYQILTITLANQLVKGSELLIKISYSGVLNTALRGFYRSSYVDSKNNTRWLATTHLEPVGARKMFPCFDEPGLKATFDLSVRRTKDYGAISNTKIASSRTDGDYILDTFETTPVMSTYLLALIVSDFEKVSDKDIYSAWAKPSAVDQAKYAVSVISPILNFFEKALGHDYQLPKLDMAAIPDFSAGAMENWGLITYKETAMLHHDQHTPTTSKQSIINVIAHEIAHQWFGNLVSPEWWACVWLSEGFARYYQYHATAKIENSWQLESQFVVEALQTSFATDGLSSSHPMTHDVNTPNEISSRFNDISYSKAASVIRMIEKTFGSDFFNKSLHSYLENRKYNTTIPTYLFDAFQKQADAEGIKLTASVTDILNTWTLQAGYPVVNVTRSEKVIALSQERFLLSNPDNTDIKKLWWIPITWTSKSKPDFSNTKPTSWLNETTKSLTIETAKDDWFILNIQQSGYYRVNYDRNSWETIINVLKSNNFKDIHEINRAALLDDVLNLARASYVDYKIALSMTEYLVNETNYIPWRAAFNGLSFLNKMFSGKDIYDLYRTHVLTNLKPIYKKLGTEAIKGEPHTDKILRRYVFNWACSFNDQECISKSKEMFASWRSNKTQTVPVDIRNTVYCTAIKYGSAEDWEFLEANLLTTNVRVEEETINSALACTKDSSKLNRILRNAMNRNSNELSLYELITSVIASGNFGVEYIMNFMKTHADTVHDYFKNDDSQFQKLLQLISPELSTKSQIEMFENFINDDKVRLAKTDQIKSLVTRAQEDIDWYDLHSPEIFEWLDTKYPSGDYRLPTSIMPLKYDIYLTPYIIEKNFTFDGETRISMKTTRNISSVVLHANKLTIRKISAQINSVQPLKVSSYQLNSTTHRLSIYFTTIVTEGTELTVNIQYTGILNNKMEGFYRSSYVDDSGKTRWLASTQFQKFGARQAFPCFDEPSMKATFAIYIERENKYHTRSNMMLQNSVPSDTRKDYTWDLYEESVPMSTYLVAFVVSDFEAIHNNNKNFSVWARPNAIEDAKIALDFGEKTLKFLENYTAIEYPLSKVDLIAVPDFAAGAMENFGAVTFREYGLLVQESVTSASYMRYMHTVIAHELTHFWFGDLVTCHWWDRLWLNEGFAEYFQWVTVDAIKPEWAAMDQFVVYELQVALSKDSVSTMRPMDNVMATPYDSGEGNSAVIYGKAASVIHMMRNGLGEEIFQRGLNIYLTKNQYSTGTSEKLWSALQESMDVVGGFTSVDESVRTLMDSWASQPGYPVVHVNIDKANIELKQERFLITGRNKSAETRTYWIPITYATKSKPTFNRTSPVFWFGEEFEQITNNDITVDEWYILNVKQSGFYRVNYEVTNWERLIDALNDEDFGGIHEINRAQIIDDILNLAQGDYVSYELALRATTYLENEVKHLPWRSFFNSIAYLVDRFDGQQVESYFKTYVRGLIDKVYKKVGFVGAPLDTQLDGLNRQTILSWACKFELADCIEQSKTLFEKLKKNETKIDRDAKQALYCTALKYGDFNDWMFLWEEYEKTNLESEKVTILNSLGCTRNETAIEHYFNIVLSRDTSIRDQNVDLVFSSVYKADGFGVNITLKYLMKNYKKLYDYYGAWGDVGGIFSSVATKISTQNQIDELQRFIENTSELKEISGSLNSSVKIAKNNLAWYTNHSSTILNWLHVTDEKPDGSKPSSSPPVFVSEHLIIFSLMGIFLYFVTY